MIKERITEREPRLRIPLVVMVRDGTLLPCIWQYTQKANSDAYISLVVTGKKDSPAFTFATERNIPIRRMAQRFSEGETLEEFGTRCGSLIKGWLDQSGSRKYLVISAGWHRVMPKEFIRCFEPEQIINTHPGLLGDNPADSMVRLSNGEMIPSSRNMYDPGPIERAWKEGYKWTGATVQYLVEETDAGTVITREEVPVEENDTLETLSERVHSLEFQMVPRAIDIALKRIAIKP